MKSKHLPRERNQSGTRSGRTSLRRHLFRQANMETPADPGNGCSRFMRPESRHRRARTTFATPVPATLQTPAAQVRQRNCRISKKLSPVAGPQLMTLRQVDSLQMEALARAKKTGEP